MTAEARSLKIHVIEPTLKYLNAVDSSAIKLLLGTAAVESNLKPLCSYSSESSESGIGLFNITQQRHTDIWDKYLAFDPDLASQIRGLASQRTFLSNPHTELSTNLAYATGIAWCIYKRSNLVLNDDSTPYLAECWRRYFRTSESNCTPYDFCRSYQDLILDNTHIDAEDCSHKSFNAA